MTINLAVAKDFYLAGMKEGWPYDKVAKQVPGLPGHYVYTYTDGDWDMADMFVISTGSSTSSGTTTIWQHKRVVWTMQYWGRYGKEEQPFLKLALRAAYDKQSFVGGRGPLRYQGTGDYSHLLYENLPSNLNFDIFSGEEKITNLAANRVVGWHGYSGIGFYQ